jgi:hypothetical protein
MERQLAGIIADHLRATTGRSPSESERKSWRRSLLVLAQDLMEAGLGNVEMLIEYQLPLTSRRADVVLAGVDRRTGGDAYVVVELKQWSRAELYEDSERLVVVQGMHRELEHPLLQVQDYCNYISSFVASLQGHDTAVRGVAYLHNALDPDVEDLFEFTTTERTRLFTKSRRGAFLEYLRDQFTTDQGAGAADRLLTSAARPSKQLMKLAASEIKDREQFNLLDEQRVAYEIVMHAVEKARRSDAKEVVVITGGPGSTGPGRSSATSGWRRTGSGSRRSRRWWRTPTSGAVHVMFDHGYVGVDPSYRLRVSPRLRSEFGNGESFYAKAGEVITLPERRADRPNPGFCLELFKHARDDGGLDV